MDRGPQYAYYLYAKEQPVSKGDPLWERPFPGQIYASKPFTAQSQSQSIRVGQYFDAIQAFLEHKGNSLIARVAGKQIGQRLAPEEIDRIDVFLAKHGPFYQPAKIEAVIGRMKKAFVLNVALSEAGRGCIKREYYLLNMLNDRFGVSYLPAVYGYAEEPLNSGMIAKMVLGEWLQGYREFHMHPATSNQRGEIDVWNTEPGGLSLKQDQAAAVYRQAAKILSHFYNLETFEQIYPWHHAAGDFVVRVKNGVPDVKLITVRQYASMIDCSPEDRREILWDALLYFLLNLSIRMRLDRVEGTGDTIWSEAYVVEEAVKGFSQAMDVKPPLDWFPIHPFEAFKLYAGQLTESDWFSMAGEVVSGYHPGAPEIELIHASLNHHVVTLYRSFQSLMG
jgi:hypothetical protein